MNANDIKRAVKNVDFDRRCTCAYDFLKGPFIHDIDCPMYDKTAIKTQFERLRQKLRDNWGVTLRDKGRWFAHDYCVDHVNRHDRYRTLKEIKKKYFKKNGEKRKRISTL